MADNKMINLSAASLAYIGDAVFELHVRKMLLAQGGRSLNKLNAQARKYVAASAQAKMYQHISPYLSDEEQAVMKRGRNLHSSSRAKSAGVSEYRHATGVETLFGYLYVYDRHERLEEVFKLCTEI